jgi:hypothetical protein
MDRIGADVELQLARFDGQGSMPRIVAAWPGAVGGEVGRNAWPARVGRDGTLHVHTSSSVWAFELGQLAPKILERLRDTLGGQAPTALRFAPGHLPETPSATPEAVVRPAPAPSPAVVERAATLAGGIADEELRSRVARAAELGLSRLPDDRSL